MSAALRIVLVTVVIAISLDSYPPTKVSPRANFTTVFLFPASSSARSTRNVTAQLTILPSALIPSRRSDTKNTATSHRSPSLSHHSPLDHHNTPYLHQSQAAVPGHSVTFSQKLRVAVLLPKYEHTPNVRCQNSYSTSRLRTYTLDHKCPIGEKAAAKEV